MEGVKRLSGSGCLSHYLCCFCRGMERRKNEISVLPYLIK